MTLSRGPQPPQALRRLHRSRRHLARRRRGRVRLLPRALGLRQDHPAARHRRARSADLRHDPAEGARRLGACRRPQRDFGIVFQSYALFPNLTVADNVGYGLVSRRQSSARDRDARRRTAGAGRPARRRAANIRRSSRAASSSAWRWRARSRPRPACCCSTSRCRRSMRACGCACAHEIKALQRRLGVTTIMVTHDQEEALTMADRIVVMNQGAIEQVGTPQEIYRRAGDGLRRRLRRRDELPRRHASRRPTASRSAACRFDCPAQDGLAPGSKVRLCIRPEDVRVRDLPADVANRRRRRGRRARFRRRLLPRHAEACAPTAWR